jgi:hypothetical protein
MPCMASLVTNMIPSSQPATHLLQCSLVISSQLVPKPVQAQNRSCQTLELYDALCSGVWMLFARSIKHA